MPLLRLIELNRLWEKAPPLFVAVNQMRMMMRGYLGIKDERPMTGEEEEGNMGDLLGDLAACGIEVNNG